MLGLGGVVTMGGVGQVVANLGAGPGGLNSPARRGKAGPLQIQTDFI